MSDETQNPMTAGTQPITVLMVDDQEIMAAAVRNMLKDEPDICFHYCSDPTAAIETANTVNPTVILQDMVMPDIDGLTLVRFFRANPATKDVPVVVLSSKEEPKTKADSFACGANDYVVKLPDKLELVARIRYHSKGYIALQQRNHAYRALANELAEAADYVKSILPLPRSETPVADWVYVPSTALGGDAFGYHWIDPEHFAVYLLDVCGHGVGAALLSVSVMTVVRSQSLPNVNFRKPADVLEALNDTFQMEKHNSMYFTMWYGVFNKTTRELSYASAGHPPALLLTGPDVASAQPKSLSTGGLVVGAIPHTEYQNAKCSMDAFSSLVVFSDGTYEVTQKASGTLWSMQEWNALLVQHIRSPDSGGLASVRQQVINIQGSDQFDDDFSLLKIEF